MQKYDRERIRRNERKAEMKENMQSLEREFSKTGNI